MSTDTDAPQFTNRADVANFLTRAPTAAETQALDHAAATGGASALKAAQAALAATMHGETGLDGFVVIEGAPTTPTAATVLDGHRAKASAIGSSGVQATEFAELETLAAGLETIRRDAGQLEVEVARDLGTALDAFQGEVRKVTAAAEARGYDAHEVALIRLLAKTAASWERVRKIARAAGVPL